MLHSILGAYRSLLVGLAKDSPSEMLGKKLMFNMLNLNCAFLISLVDIALTISQIRSASVDEAGKACHPILGD